MINFQKLLNPTSHISKLNLMLKSLFYFKLYKYFRLWETTTQRWISLFQLSEAPSAHRGNLGAETISTKNKEADKEIEAMLAQLKS